MPLENSPGPSRTIWLQMGAAYLAILLGAVGLISRWPWEYSCTNWAAHPGRYLGNHQCRPEAIIGHSTGCPGLAGRDWGALRVLEEGVGNASAAAVSFNQGLTAAEQFNDNLKHRFPPADVTGIAGRERWDPAGREDTGAEIPRLRDNLAEVSLGPEGAHRKIRIKKEDLTTIITPARGKAVIIDQESAILRTVPQEEFARRQTLVSRILEKSLERSIAPLTTAELVRKARKKERRSHASR